MDEARWLVDRAARVEARHPVSVRYFHGVEGGVENGFGEAM
jgi:hypothetical protein